MSDGEVTNKAVLNARPL